MKHIVCLSLSLGLLGLLAPAAVRAQGNADEVTYFDRAKKKDDTHKGPILSESPAGIVVEVKGQRITLPVGDIRSVTYQVPLAQRAFYRRALSAEEDYEKAADPDKRKDAFTKALTAFQNFQQEVKEPIPPLARDMQFRFARLHARQAEDDQAQADEAIKLLAAFLKDNPDAWQLIGAAKLLGVLQEQKGDRAGALKTYRAVASNALVPKEVRQEFGVRQAQALIHSKPPQYAEAKRQLEQMAVGLPPDDPQAQRIAVHLTECQVAEGNFAEAEAKLKAILKSNADGAVKALACNTLADGYLAAKNSDEALWYYLWVDTVYTQDKQERARAVYHLSKLFEQARNDSARAQQFRDRLLKEKEFEGTDWQRHAQAEK